MPGPWRAGQPSPDDSSSGRCAARSSSAGQRDALGALATPSRPGFPARQARTASAARLAAGSLTPRDLGAPRTLRASASPSRLVVALSDVPAPAPGLRTPAPVRFVPCSITPFSARRPRPDHLPSASRLRLPPLPAAHLPRRRIPAGSWRVDGAAGTRSRCCAGMCCSSEWVNESSRRWPDRK